MGDPSSRSNEDKRRKLRISRRFPAQFLVDGETRKARGIVRNFSEVGMFIQTRNLLKRGTKVQVELHSENDQIFVVKGEVVWTKQTPQMITGASPGGLGIALSAAPADYLQFVSNLRGELEEAPRGVEERFEVFLSVDLVEPGGKVQKGNTENLSLGGMFVSVLNPVKVNEIVGISLKIPGIDDPLELKGRTAYQLTSEEAKKNGRSAGGMGIEFQNLSEYSKNILTHYIHRLETHRSHPERRRVDQIPSSGNLGEVLVPEILLHFKEKNLSGTLVIRKRGITKKIYFRNGLPIFVDSTLRNDAFGPYLLRIEKIRPDELEQSLMELTQGDLALGEILIQRGVLKSNEMNILLRDQHEEKLMNCFPWFEGDYDFTEESKLPAHVTILPLRPYHVFFKGIERWYDEPLVRTWMGLDEHTGIIKKDLPPAEASAPSLVFSVLQLCYESKTIRQIAMDLDEAEGKIFSVAFSLIIAGWAEIHFSDALESSREAAKPQETAKSDSRPIDPRFAFVAKDFSNLSSKNFYELLEIEGGFKEGELELAFQQAAREYLKLPFQEIEDSSLRDQAAQVLGWFRLAYETLKDPYLRQLYAIRESKKNRAKMKHEQIEAERCLLRGMSWIEKNNYRKALECFEDGLRRYAEDPSLPGYKGWALFLMDPKKNLHEAKDLMRASFDRDPSDPQLNYFIGEINVYLQNWTRAERIFQQTLRLQPNFIRAKRALEKVQLEIQRLK